MRWLLLAMSLALVGGCRGQQRPDAVRALVREVVLPGYQEAARCSHALTAALAAFEATPDPARLASARQAWRKAAVAWRRLLPFRLGSVGESGVLSRTSYWPPQPAAIDRLLGSPRPIDADLIAEAGASAKGLFAVERLLFAESASTPAAARSRLLMKAFAGDIEAAAATALRNLEGEAERLAARPTDTVNALVEHLYEAVDVLTATRLAYALAAPPAMLRSRPVEGQASGSSLTLALAVLEGAEAIYTAGLEPLVPVPTVAAGMRATLRSARVATAAIGGPIEEAARSRPDAVRDAALATRALERAFKAELSGALGVTITFRSGDGD